MRAGPLRQLAGAVGLLALIPTAGMLAVGQITAVDAAVRAGATLIGVQLLARIAAWWLGSFIASIEVTSEPSDEPSTQRRRSDRRPHDADPSAAPVA